LTLDTDTRADDLVQPFQIDPFALRGRLVRLGPTVDRILSRHAYPEPVAAILGEAITLAVVLAGALKYDGVFSLQTKSDGPVRLLVADVSTEGGVRGYAQYDADRLDPKASPMRAKDLAGQPPTMVVTAGFDPLRDEGLAYADALETAGVTVRRLRYDGGIHGFMTMPVLELAQRARADVGREVSQLVSAARAT